MTTVAGAMRPARERMRTSALGAVTLHSAPFRYFLARRCLPRGIEQALLAWFETDAPWRLVETNFYEQYEFSMLDTAVPETVCPLIALDCVASMRREMAAIFGVAFDDRTRLVAHKLIPGQRIAIHNDYLAGEETHRLIVQLNRDLRDEDGGLFMLFNSVDPNDIHRIVRPVNGSAIGFEIGENSNHAVSRLYGEERYTLVYSFCARSGAWRASRPG